MRTGSGLGRPGTRESRPSIDVPAPIRRLYRATEALDVSGDRTEARLLRRLQLSMVFASIPAISALGVLYVAGGHAGVSWWCFGYAIVSAVLVVLLAITGNFAVIRVPHTLC